MKKNKIKKALITGVTGQDGSYLSELLLSNGYEVYGIIRRSSSFNTKRIEHLYKNKNFHTFYGDLVDTNSIRKLISKINPNEIYNLGAQSHVKISFDLPEYSTDVDGLGTLRMLEAIRDINKKIKFYQASTSELYGHTSGKASQNENTEFRPRSPYAVAKLYSYWIVKMYREAYGLYATNGILFNHESPRRGENFVTRKITIEAAKIKLGISKQFEIGNIYSKRDWGYAPEYVEGMWKMLQQKKPDDFVLSTGETHSVKEFINEVFSYLKMEIYWKKQNKYEHAFLKSNNQKVVKVNPIYFRPSEIDYLIGDYTKAKKQLKWSPKIKFKQLVKIMADNDLKLLKNNEIKI